jgi:hypothetical protein
MLLRSANHKTMLTNLDSPTPIGEAMPVALPKPCWHSLDARRQFGYVLALTGRCAR